MTKHAYLLALPFAVLGCGDAETPTGWDPVVDPPEGVIETPDPAGTISSPVVAAVETAVYVSDELSADAPPRDAQSFELIDTASLYFYAYFPTMTEGSHVAVFEIDGPDGYLYDTIYAQFTIGTTAVAGCTLTELGWRVVVELPVAGTRIDHYGLTGTWGAHMLLDVVAGPALVDTSFDLYQTLAN